LIDCEPWLRATLGDDLTNLALYQRALNHGSLVSENYERLEFLGDRVLGLVIAATLYETFPNEKEGNLSRRLNSLVSGETCAKVARSLDIGPLIKMGKQARDDGAYNSTNVLGDVIEALIGALYLDKGLDSARAFILKHWAELIEKAETAPRHPKSALQEWAAANNRKPPVYAVKNWSGPHHAPRFSVTVSLGSAGSAEAEGKSKQEAETAAAAALLEMLEK
jgi:ribonuclease III